MQSCRCVAEGEQLFSVMECNYVKWLVRFFVHLVYVVFVESSLEPRVLPTGESIFVHLDRSRLIMICRVIVLTCLVASVRSEVLPVRQSRSLPLIDVAWF